MGGELHAGAVTFRALDAGREQIVLGCIPIGEIGPVRDSRSLYPTWFRIDLPYTGCIARVRPAEGIEDAKRQVRETVDKWLTAAGLRPNGGA